MSVENNSNKSESKGRGRSMTGFPYVDLDNGVETAKGVISSGGVSCTFQQLADAVGNDVESNALRIRVNTTWRQYGLILVNKDQISLTDLGRAVLDSATEKKARIEAFFRVPLYRDLFDKFCGETLPPPKEVERIMEDFGIAPLQKARARQIFMRSAKQAGLFDQSEISLSIPSGVEFAAIDSSREPIAEKLATVSDEGKRNIYDPAIEGILKRLPELDSEWPLNERVKWLRALSGALDLAYKAPKEDNVTFIEIAKKTI